jgi:hypothetical protein
MNLRMVLVFLSSFGGRTSCRPLPQKAVFFHLCKFVLSLYLFNYEYICIRFEVLTAVVMKSSIFWDITPCSPLNVNNCFGGTCRLNLQGRRKSQVKYQREAGGKLIL